MFNRLFSTFSILCSRQQFSKVSLASTKLATKATFALSCIGTISTIFYVHYKQQFDKEQIHLGVVRDQERQARRRRENIYLLQQQIALGEELRKEQQKNTV